MSKMLADKVIMVTGAAAGIGKAACEIFAREGGKVIGIDLDHAGGEATADGIVQMGCNARFFSADVTNEAEVEAAVAFAVATYGSLDGAFNNAAVAEPPIGLLSATNETFSRVLTVNLKGIWLCMRAQIRQFQKQEKGGAIVNVASAAGLQGEMLMPIYSASKHAVIGLTKSAGLEFARSGLRINAICPGATETPMLLATFAGDEVALKGALAAQPNGRFAKPEEIAAAAAWLLCDAASFVNGAAIPVDGSLTS